VPWCEGCDRFLSPSTVRTDGRCPSCGRVVYAGAAHGPEVASETEDELGPIPWHLKLLAGALAVYLGYRAMQGIEWLAGKL
jgi:hypothetical protein